MKTPVRGSGLGEGAADGLEEAVGEGGADLGRGGVGREGFGGGNQGVAVGGEGDAGDGNAIVGAVIDAEVVDVELEGLAGLKAEIGQAGTFTEGSGDGELEGGVVGEGTEGGDGAIGAVEGGGVCGAEVGGHADGDVEVGGGDGVLAGRWVEDGVVALRGRAGGEATDEEEGEEQGGEEAVHGLILDGFVKDEAGGLLADFPDEGLGGGGGAGKRGEGLFEVFGEGGCVYVRAKLGEGGVGLGDEGFGLLEGLF